MTTITENKVYESKWGYHPCDRETYMKLKKLNYWFLKAQKRAAEWNRWARKDEHNRVIREFIRNDKGQKIGVEILGPKPEPQNIEGPFCNFHTAKENNRYGCRRTSQTYWLNKGDLQIEWETMRAKNGERYCYHSGLYVDSFGIDRDYQNAKRPTTKESVQPLKNSVEQIDELYEKVLEWQNNL